MKNMSTLEETARTLVAPGKGILAADESMGTCDKRFDKYGIPKTEEMRRTWRQLLLSTPGVEKGLSGVILFEETLRQKTDDGTPFPEFLARRGILPGIKVDQGTEPMPGSPDEKLTKGLDGLPERLKEYAALGAKFAKWRAVIAIGDNLPSETCIRENAKRLAQYALDCEEAGLVPIIEPEVLLDGSHTFARSEEVLTETLKVVFEEMKKASVGLSGLILKSSMALPGKESGQKVPDDLVAVATLRAFWRYVPFEVPGIVFLSGGQTPEEATLRLNEIAKKLIDQHKGPAPLWKISFSYSRALQEPVLARWAGQEANVREAQRIFQKRVAETAAASLGEFKPA